MSLEIESRGGLCELRLASPPGNVIDAALCSRIEEEIRARAGDPHLKAFLLTAQGKHFSYGASVPEHRAEEVGNFLPRFHGLCKTLVACDVPLIAAVRGLCLGGAFELVGCATFVVAEEGASFAVPEIKLGVIPPAACAILPSRLGEAVTEDLVLTGRNMDAAEAMRHGLVTRICHAGELESAAQAFFDEQIRPKSAQALRLALHALRAPVTAGIQARMDELESFYLERVMATRDANEGIAAFLEKREPRWEDA